jgi:hypothetical protein
MAFKQIQLSVSSNGTLTPYADGAGWIGQNVSSTLFEAILTIHAGTWTLPVCDIGTHQWNTQFGNKTSRYGMLPCCCGNPPFSSTKPFHAPRNELTPLQVPIAKTPRHSSRPPTSTASRHFSGAAKRSSMGPTWISITSTTVSSGKNLVR